MLWPCLIWDKGAVLFTEIISANSHKNLKREGSQHIRSRNRKWESERFSEFPQATQLESRHQNPFPSLTLQHFISLNLISALSLRRLEKRPRTLKKTPESFCVDHYFSPCLSPDSDQPIGLCLHQAMSQSRAGSGQEKSLQAGKPSVQCHSDPACCHKDQGNGSLAFCE